MYTYALEITWDQVCLPPYILHLSCVNTEDWPVMLQVLSSLQYNIMVELTKWFNVNVLAFGIGSVDLHQIVEMTHIVLIIWRRNSCSSYSTVGECLHSTQLILLLQDTSVARQPLAAAADGTHTSCNSLVYSFAWWGSHLNRRLDSHVMHVTMDAAVGVTGCIWSQLWIGNGSV